MKNIFDSKLSLMEILAEDITVKINKQLNKEEEQLQKMRLGLEILLINLSKFLIIFILAAMLDLLKEVVFITIVFASIRSSSFGLHARNSIICTIITIIMFIGGAYLSKYLKLNNYEIFIIFNILNVLLYRYAPADTENHPLLGTNFRKELRKKTILKAMFLMVLAIVIPNNKIKVLITLAVLEQTLSILPITYKLLKRRYNNYEKYEKCITQ